LAGWVRASTTDQVERRPAAGTWLGLALVVLAFVAIPIVPAIVSEAAPSANRSRVAEALDAEPPPPTSLPPLPVPDPAAWPGRPSAVATGSRLAILRHHAIDVVDLASGVVTRHRLDDLDDFFPSIDAAVPAAVAWRQRAPAVTVPPDGSLVVASDDQWTLEAAPCPLGGCALTLTQFDTGATIDAPEIRHIDLDLYALADPIAAAYAPITGYVATFVDTRQGDRVALVVIDGEGLRHFTTTRPVIGGGAGLLAWDEDGTTLFHTYRGDSTLRAFSPGDTGDRWATAELRLRDAIALRVLAPE